MGVAWQGGRGEADRGYRSNPLTKLDNRCRSPKFFTTPNKGRHLHPMVEPPSPISRHFPCPFVGSPTDLSGCSWLQGLALFLTSTCSLRSGHGAAPLGISTRKAKAVPGLGGSHWHCVATVCLPTFSSVDGEPQLLLPSSLGEGTGFILSSTDQWLLSKTA